MSDPIDIPFNRIFVSKAEAQNVAASVATGFIGGDGPYTKRCEDILEQIYAGSRALLTTSCTHAIEMTALLLDIDQEAEVIVPSFTFSSTANAFALRGAKIVFADIRPDTLNIDEKHVESLITPQTKAIVVVHYAGVACDMDRISAIADANGISVIEDNAHGFLGSWHGKPLGSFGLMSTLSFHESKNITCGEGGALIINDDALNERAEILREKGTDRRRFFRGLVDKYSWVDVGSSYVLADILAAFLLAQLERRLETQQLRARVWERYSTDLAQWAADEGVQLPYVPPGALQPAHLFYLIMPAEETRNRYIAHMRSHGIGVAFHYLPLHSSKMAIASHWATTECPVTESVSAKLVRLPVYAGLSNGEQDRVLEATLDFRI